MDHDISVGLSVPPLDLRACTTQVGSPAFAPKRKSDRKAPGDSEVSTGALALPGTSGGTLGERRSHYKSKGRRTAIARRANRARDRGRRLGIRARLEQRSDRAG